MEIQENGSQPTSQGGPVTAGIIMYWDANQPAMDQCTPLDIFIILPPNMEEWSKIWDPTASLPSMTIVSLESTSSRPTSSTTPTT